MTRRWHSSAVLATAAGRRDASWRLRAATAESRLSSRAVWADVGRAGPRIEVAPPGFEPGHPFGPRILNPLRLPIPPRGPLVSMDRAEGLRRARCYRSLREFAGRLGTEQTIARRGSPH